MLGKTHASTAVLLIAMLPMLAACQSVHRRDKTRVQSVVGDQPQVVVPVSYQDPVSVSVGGNEVVPAVSVQAGPNTQVTVGQPSIPPQPGALIPTAAGCNCGPRAVPMQPAPMQRMQPIPQAMPSVAPPAAVAAPMPMMGGSTGSNFVPSAGFLAPMPGPGQVPGPGSLGPGSVPAAPQPLSMPQAQAGPAIGQGFLSGEAIVGMKLRPKPAPLGVYGPTGSQPELREVPGPAPGKLEAPAPPDASALSKRGKTAPTLPAGGPPPLAPPAGIQPPAPKILAGGIKSVTPAPASMPSTPPGLPGPAEAALTSGPPSLPQPPAATPDDLPAPPSLPVLDNGQLPTFKAPGKTELVP